MATDDGALSSAKVKRPVSSSDPPDVDKSLSRGKLQRLLVHSPDNSVQGFTPDDLGKARDGDYCRVFGKATADRA